MKQQNICIIGGASGLIGQEIVKAFCEAGYTVFGLDMEDSSQNYEQYTFFQSDLTSEKEIESNFKTIFQENFKNCTLINCQAIAHPYSGKLEDLEISTWQKYLDINITSSMLTSREVIRHKDQWEKLSIIHFSSVRHLMSEPNSECYATTKSAIIGLTHAQAISLGELNVRVNSVSPGWIAGEDENLSEKDHKQHPIGRAGRPQDIANLCLFLSSTESEFITGQDIVSDGGMCKKMIYL